MPKYYIVKMYRWWRLHVTPTKRCSVYEAKLTPQKELRWVRTSSSSFNSLEWWKENYEVLDYNPKEHDKMIIQETIDRMNQGMFN